MSSINGISFPCHESDGQNSILVVKILKLDFACMIAPSLDSDVQLAISIPGRHLFCTIMS
jgi:hypothetical protein